jgi:protein-disulfide isomerase
MSAEECDFCGEELEEGQDLHIHWMEEHEEELNSHQKEKAKKAEREREERKQIKKEQRKKYLFQGLGAAVLLALAVLILPQIIPSGGADSELNLEGEPVIGDENASVTVVEYGDFECPACRDFKQSTYEQMKSDYIDTGQVKFVWKDYPLEQVHPWARTAAETAECTYRQNKSAFWEVNTQIFSNQGVLTLENAEEELIGYAIDAGVDEEELRSCIENENPGNEVTQDINEGRVNGVSGTPTIFVNGEKLDSFDYGTVSQAIEDELS